MVVAKAGAAEKGLPLYAYLSELAGSKKPYVLPVPSMNVINGGAHAGNALAFQEFMILPTGAKNFEEAMKIGTEVYHNLKKVINAKYGIDATNVGDEGGFAPNVKSADEALDLLMEAISKAGHEGLVKIGIDPASSEFFKDGKYDLDFKSRTRTRASTSRASSSPSCTRATSRSIRLSLLRIRLIRMTGLPGRTCVLSRA